MLLVDLNDGGTESVTFDNAIIATGSSTWLISAPHCRPTKSPARNQDPVPRALEMWIIIAGAGAIGMEFGYAEELRR